MEDKIDIVLAEKVKSAKRVSLEITDKDGYRMTVKLEPFIFKYIASALKSALYVKESLLKNTGRTLYQ